MDLVQGWSSFKPVTWGSISSRCEGQEFPKEAAEGERTSWIAEKGEAVHAVGKAWQLECEVTVVLCSSRPRQDECAPLSALFLFSPDPSLGWCGSYSGFYF